MDATHKYRGPTEHSNSSSLAPDPHPKAKDVTHAVYKRMSFSRADPTSSCYVNIAPFGMQKANKEVQTSAVQCIKHEIKIPLHVNTLIS